MAARTILVVLCVCLGVVWGGKLGPIEKDDLVLWVQAVGDQALSQLGWSRIAHGQISEVNSRPFQAAIMLRAETVTGLCTGALLSSTKVITAAVSVSHDIILTLEIILGGHFIFINEPNTVRQVVQTTAITFHPEFVDNRNNIALITLNVPVVETDTIKFINRLPTVHSDMVGRELTFAGWGGTENAITSFSTQLRQITAPVISDEACVVTLAPGVFCVRGNGGFCAGDGGAPGTMVVNGEVVLISILSHQFMGCLAGRESFHTSLDYHLTWINANI